MSHFITVVLLPGSTKKEQFQDKIAKLVAPYDENMTVKKHLVECYCVGSAARGEASEMADKKYGSIEVLRKSFAKTEVGKMIPYPKDDDNKESMKAYYKAENSQNKAWQKHIAKRIKAEEKFFETHKLKNAADPKCDECKGKGKRSTDYNPKSKWDWWVIGGRWPSYFQPDDYDPWKDPENVEECNTCYGIGKRMDDLGIKEREKDPTYTCNGCNGKGKRLKFTLRPVSTDAKVTDILKNWKKQEIVPFALVDKKGRWYEKGKMGWFALVSNEKKITEWHKQVYWVLKRHSDCIAVAVDMHI